MMMLADSDVTEKNVSFFFIPLATLGVNFAAATMTATEMQPSIMQIAFEAIGK
jgi:hypothetical protein